MTIHLICILFTLLPPFYDGFRIAIYLGVMESFKKKIHKSCQDPPSNMFCHCLSFHWTDWLKCLLELESFKNFRKYLDKKYLDSKYYFNVSSLTPIGVKISIWWRKKNCPEFDFTSSRVLQIFFNCQIFFL